MNVRKNFDTALRELKEQILNMVELSQEALIKSVESIKNQNLDLANEVILGDKKLNELEEEINNKAILMIAQQAPVATDLRRIIVALKISTDVERIGDLAVNIAKATLQIGNEKMIKPIEDIPKMVDFIVEMLSEAFTAFSQNDIEMANKVAKKDDTIDELYSQLVKELVGLMTKHPESINQILQLSFVCRYLERVGDHITNISEHVIYRVTGKRYDLNS